MISSMPSLTTTCTTPLLDLWIDCRSSRRLSRRGRPAPDSLQRSQPLSRPFAILRLPSKKAPSWITRVPAVTSPVTRAVDAISTRPVQLIEPLTSPRTVTCSADDTRLHAGRLVDHDPLLALDLALDRPAHADRALGPDRALDGGAVADDRLVPSVSGMRCRDDRMALASRRSAGRRRVGRRGPARAPRARRRRRAAPYTPPARPAESGPA